MYDLDYERLRKDLIEYFGSATPLHGVAYLYVSKLEKLSNEELVNLAIENGFDLNDYKEYVFKR